jgi:hypothetical protein
MKTAILTLLVGAFSLRAGMLVDFSPPNANALDITNARAADVFTLAGGVVITGADFWYQTDVFGAPSDLSSVAWAIYSNSGGALGSTLFSGVTAPSISFDGAHGADFASFTLPSLALGAGTYWLELHAGSSLTDNNGGLNIWWSNMDGTPAVVARDSSGLGLPNQQVTTPGFEQLAFQLTGSAAAPGVPEPSALLLLVSGAALIAWRLRSQARP